MNPPLVQLYIASSLDGFISTPDGGVEWLEPFQDLDYGYDAFLAQVETLVMGRNTYEQVRTFGEWPYAGKRTLVLTRRTPPEEPQPEGVSFYRGDVIELSRELKANDKGNIWLVGGGQTVRAFLDADLVDEFRVFLMPVLLGDGLPLFPRSHHQTRLRLEDTQTYPNGVVCLRYRQAVTDRA